MHRFLRIFSFITLPVIMLVLGWQLGARYEQQQLSVERQRLDELFSVKTGSGQVAGQDPETHVDLSLFWGTWRLLGNYYIDPGAMHADKMVFGAVSGMVDAVGDPYTAFMTPTDSKAFVDSMHGTLEGIGAQLETKNGRIIVVAPLKGSPAEKAGLLPKDIIVKVGDTQVTDVPLEQVVMLIRGKKGTSVKLTIAREGTTQPVILSVVRENIFVPSVESKVLKTASGSIGHIALNQFGDESMGEVRKAIAAFPKDGLKGVLLDLRFNGGGYLEGAVELTSMFVRDGQVVRVERRDEPPLEHRVDGQPLLPDVPLVVLINGGSASASEIVAGALQDLKRATIIGTQSFGKGTVQEVLDLPGGSSLRVTVAKWLTPGGHDLSKKGVTPDIVIDRTVEQFRDNKDPQLDAAIEWLTDKEDVTKVR